MSTVQAKLLFSLPEDIDSDTLFISESSQENGTYTSYQTLPYEYGTTSIDIALDDTRWYRLQFFNTSTTFYGPVSEPVYGGNFSAGASFLAVSSPTSGANYATTADVFEYSGLSAQDIPQKRVGQALRQARAMIDYRSEMMDFNRFEVFDSEVARRKYNAGLRILKEAEICIALGYLYQNMTDDIIIHHRREGDDSVGGSASIGGTAVGLDSLAERSENIAFMAVLSDRYFTTGENLLSTLGANSVRLQGYDYWHHSPRFLYPFNGYRQGQRWFY